jgi:hypothetical protein
MWEQMRSLASLVLCLCLCVGATAAAPRPGGGRGPELRVYETPYYLIHTDLPPEGASEARARMLRLGDALRAWTRGLGFNGKITQRLPFFLYARHADYLAATNLAPDSAGVFLGDRLVAAATDSRGSAAWHVVQHEAFHQFPAATTGTEFPAWLNEGLGEYFGEALFTGDGYAAGAVPAWRLARVKRALSDDTFEPLAGFVRISQEDWNRGMTLARYDQAWSLVQFLLHAGDCKHRDRVVRYVESLGGGRSHQQAWSEAFGDWPDVASEWKRYWQRMPEDGTPDVDALANVALVTSFLARAVAGGQQFDTFGDFTRMAAAGNLRCDPRDWLPSYLLKQALDAAAKSGTTFTLEGGGKATTLHARLPDGKELVGRFTLIDGRAYSVMVIPNALHRPEP